MNSTQPIDMQEEQTGVRRSEMNQTQQRIADLDTVIKETFIHAKDVIFQIES